MRAEEAGRMKRREFVKGIGVASGLAALPWPGLAAAADEARAQAGAPEAMGPESRRAFAELLALVAEAERRTLSAEWNVRSPQDVIDGHRVLLHLLAASIDLYYEGDPERPYWVPMPSPIRKYLGDNPDAHYFFTPLHGDRRFRIRGNTAGAAYTSFTFQGAETGAAAGITATRNHTQFDVAPDGSYELVVGPGAAGRNGIPLDARTVSVTTRHYFENATSAQLDPALRIPLSIEPEGVAPPPAPLGDAESARRIRAAARFFREGTLDMKPRDPKAQPAWVSTMPNQLGPPAVQGGREDVSAWHAVDNAYSMGPYVLAPDQALVMTGRLPKCSFANVVLWNRWMASYEYRFGRRISLNRRQMKLEPDGRYRIVIAHRDPGVANWLDTEGRPSGTIFWRFQLPEEQPEQPQAEVVALSDVAKS
jgi:hypothetical protein